MIYPMDTTVRLESYNQGLVHVKTAVHEKLLELINQSKIK